MINFANALHDLHLQPARVRLPPWVDGVVCNGRRTLRGHLEYYTVQHPMDGGTVQLSELSVGSAGDARYPERFARIDGSNCSTVLSTLDCFQTQLPSAATAAEERKSMQENRKRGRVSAAELKRAWQQLLSALSLSLSVCAPVCVDLLIVPLCYLLPTNSYASYLVEWERESERASERERSRDGDTDKIATRFMQLVDFRVDSLGQRAIGQVGERNALRSVTVVGISKLYTK